MRNWRDFAYRHNLGYCNKCGMVKKVESVAIDFHKHGWTFYIAKLSKGEDFPKRGSKLEKIVRKNVEEYARFLKRGKKQ
jgi:hypothetical protein